MNENCSMLPIPDELLESLAGGVLSDSERESIKQTAVTCKGMGHPSEAVIAMFEAWTKDTGRTEDLEEIRKIILWVYDE